MSPKPLMITALGQDRKGYSINLEATPTRAFKN
jgi:hypothetical protein